MLGVVTLASGFAPPRDKLHSEPTLGRLLAFKICSGHSLIIPRTAASGGVAPSSYSFQLRRNKKGGVDLSAFHATQGRRLVLLSQLYLVLLSQLVILRMLREGVRPCKKFLEFSNPRITLKSGRF